MRIKKILLSLSTHNRQDKLSIENEMGESIRLVAKPVSVRKWKVVFLSVLFLCVILVSGIIILKPQSFTSAPTPASPSQDIPQEIVEPVIIDGTNDTVRIQAVNGGKLTKLNVAVGQIVKTGQVLFEFDDRNAKHDLKMSQLALRETKNALMMQKQNVSYIQAQLQRLQKIDKRAISRVEIEQKKHELKMQMMQLSQIKNQLKIAQLRVKGAQRALELCTLSSPLDGIILQSNFRLHEMVGGSQTVLVMGDAKNIMVRASVEERDVQRFSPTGPAYIFDTLGQKVPLSFVRLEPFIVFSDRLGTRVQDAIYTIDREKYPNFISGQQVSASFQRK